MTGRDRFRPCRRVLPAAAVSAAPPVARYCVSVEMAPEAVTRAREAVAAGFPEVGVVAGSAFADAVLLVVSELVANVGRHAPRCPIADVELTAGAGHLVVGVADGEPRLPALGPGEMGAGLELVAELAAAYGGGIGAKPTVNRDGKVVLVRFRMPSFQAVPLKEVRGDRRVKGDGT
ncbi:ATP-binding protein [Streptomyces sp. MBT62]|uniref:ATP-binding protein n=1 Tax=Streptomyces sp. MBT62 TaxID=2800410 RepID=UPI0027DC3D4D|nr:ATP-binding protein [Streptomyces sp. MBT62]